jgi:hypothetical protein
MRMKRIARASLASFCLAIVSLAVTGALCEMIGKWRDEQRFASHIMRVLISRLWPFSCSGGTFA